MPDTGALADHVSTEEMEDHLQWAVEKARSDPARPVFVHLGFHAETAHHFAPRLTRAPVSPG